MQQNQNWTDNRNMLAEKELLYIQDYLSWELLAMKKCQDIRSRTGDADIQNVMKQVGNKHKQHYETLLQHLQ